MKKKSLTDKHIVFDIDETLVHTCNSMKKYKKFKLYSSGENADIRDRFYTISMVDVVETSGSGSEYNMWGIFRPHLLEFLEFVFEYFEEVHIWSAGQYLYVHAMADVIFYAKNYIINHILTYEDCDFVRKDENGEKYTETFKPLTKFLDVSDGANSKNTFIIDDRTDTFSKNPKNGILIPKYNPDFTREDILKDETSLLELKKWFMKKEVMESKDVRKLKKDDIFSKENFNKWE
jgi:hypothetical protein